MKFKMLPEEPEVGFQIAPMSDVVFQMLIFFLVAATFSQMEVASDVALPIADASQPKQQEGVTELRINVLADGQVKVGSEMYPVEQLAAELRRVAAATEGEKKVIIRGDQKAHYGKMMRIMASCAQADLWNVSFATYQEDKSKKGTQ